MKRYEMIREIFNQCSGNQMRDVFFSEVELEDPEEIIKQYCKGTVTQYDRTDKADGSIIFDYTTDGLHQRISLCEI